MNKTFFRLAAACLLALLSSCSSSKNQLKVAATPVPQAEMLEYIRPDLKAQGIDLVIITMYDYYLPNRALAHKDVDANFFQHIPFMEEQIKQFNYPIMSIGKIEIEPMGIYSKKYKSLADLPDNATIALPSDPSNEGRALLLLQAQGLIKLSDPKNMYSTVLNIASNPKNIQFIEVDASLTPRALATADAAAINTNWALQADLSPLRDAIALESKDSPYADIIAVRDGDQNRPEILALKAAMTSDKMRQFILSKYEGAVLPAF
jgi:D-methionine transport system substrate-binding protein